MLELVGEWKGSADPGPDGASPTLDDTGWKSLKLPGSFSKQGLIGSEVWLRRHVELPPNLVGQDLELIVTSTRNSPLAAYANGQLIGSKGDTDTGFVGSDSRHEGFTVPGALTADGRLVITFKLTSISPVRNGVVDNHIWLGPRRLLTPALFRLASISGFLEYGVLLLLVFLGGLVLVLRFLQGDRANKPLYFGTLTLIFGAVSYMVTKTGFLIANLVSPNIAVQFVGLSVPLVGLGVFEFCETYYLARVTLLRRVNRWVTVAALVLTFVPALGGGVYSLYVKWLLVLLLYLIGLAVRDLFKNKNLFGPLIASAVIFVVLTAANDLLGDLDIIYLPRLFLGSISNLAIASSIVVIGDFIRLAEENTILSSSLQTRAQELASALVDAEESSRVKSEFLANTSHELRTPLNAIINIPQGLLEQIQPVRQARCESCHAQFELEPDEPFGAATACPTCACATLTLHRTQVMTMPPEETARLLNSVVRSGSHLLSVVNDILDYSKLEAGRVVLHTEPILGTEVLEELRIAMGPVAERAHVNLVIVPLRGDITLEFDRVKVNQALINLVSNAIKFSDGKGTVTISATLTQASGEQRMIVAVKDEGIGIARENHHLIFDGFRQVEGANTRRFGGTGLGLAISKRMIELHGGRLWLESELGQGSTFFIELPLIAKAQEPELPAGTRVIVVVDDEVTALDTAAIALKPMGCQVVGIREPREAMARILSAAPALIVLDVMMPRVSGIELLRAIKADGRLSHIPVLVSSAYSDNRAAVEALGATFLAKPWRPGEALRTATALVTARATPPLETR